jgi:hypothetical protein
LVFVIGIKPLNWSQKRGGMLSSIIFGRFLAAKIEFSYGAGQTVNLLALRLQGSNPLLPTAITEPFFKF